MADDEDAIYVDVVPKLDEKAADDIAKKLDDKFKDTGKNIGEHLKDAIKGAGGALKDYLEDDIKDAVKDYGRNLRDEIKSGDFKGALEDIGGTVERTTDLISNAGKVFGVNGIDSVGKAITGTISKLENSIDNVTNRIHSFTDGVAGFKSGEYTKGIADLSQAFKGIVPDSLLDNANNVVKTFSDAHDTIKSTITDTIDTGKQLRDALGFAAGGAGAGLLSGTAEATGPLAALLAAGWTAGTLGFGPLFKHDFDSWAHGDQGIPVPKHALGGFPDKPVPGLAVVTGSGTPTPMSRPDSFAPLDLPDNPAIPTNSPLYAPRPVVGGGGGGTGSANIQAAQASVQAATATVVASAINLGGLSLPQVVSSASSSASSGPGSKSWWGSSASSTPSFASGFPTLSRAGGGVLPGSSPGYDNLLGAMGGTPVGLEGGEYVVNPQATQANLGLLQAINGGMMGFDEGGGPIGQVLGGQTNIHQQPAGGVTSGGKPQSPGGIKGQLPGGVQSAPSQPLKSADEPSPPQTIIPQGKGKGFDISGGLLGTAEGAAAEGIGLAADAFAPGSGAAASQATQILTQEINRGIAYGVRAGTTAAVEAPLDTFWLSDSGLSDPSHSWFGKLGLNLIGQTGGAIQNLAGKTQAPLTPGQGDGSPLGGQQGKTAGPLIHIENQNNGSDVDHEANNRSMINQMAAYGGSGGYF